MSEAVKQWIAQELDKLNWTHAQLATQAGISRPLVSRTLRGDMPPSCEFCIKVAIALDVSPEYVLRLASILPGEPTGADDSPIVQEIAGIAANLPLERRKELLKYARYLAQDNKDE